MLLHSGIDQSKVLTKTTYRSVHKIALTVQGSDIYIFFVLLGDIIFSLILGVQKCPLIFGSEPANCVP